MQSTSVGKGWYLGVDVRLLGLGKEAECCEETLPDSLTVVEDSVDDDGCHGCEAKSV